MKAFHSYWSFSAIRGVLTIIVSVGIFGLPYFAHALMTIPVMIGLAIDVLAVYAMLEGGALVLLGVSMPENLGGHKTRYVEAFASVGIGAVLFVLAHGEFIQYLMWIVAAQAAIAAIAEYSVARETYREYARPSCYVTAFVLAACAFLVPPGLAWLQPLITSFWLSPLTLAFTAQSKSCSLSGCSSSSIAPSTQPPHSPMRGALN